MFQELEKMLNNKRTKQSALLDKLVESPLIDKNPDGFFSKVILHFHKFPDRKVLKDFFTKLINKELSLHGKKVEYCKHFIRIFSRVITQETVDLSIDILEENIVNLKTLDYFTINDFRVLIDKIKSFCYINGRETDDLTIDNIATEVDKFTNFKESNEHVSRALNAIGYIVKLGSKEKLEGIQDFVFPSELNACLANMCTGVSADTIRGNQVDSLIKYVDTKIDKKEADILYTPSVVAKKIDISEKPNLPSDIGFLISLIGLRYSDKFLHGVARYGKALDMDENKVEQLYSALRSMNQKNENDFDTRQIDDIDAAEEETDNKTKKKKSEKITWSDIYTTRHIKKDTYTEEIASIDFSSLANEDSLSLFKKKIGSNETEWFSNHEVDIRTVSRITNTFFRTKLSDTNFCLID